MTVTQDLHTILHMTDSKAITELRARHQVKATALTTAFGTMFGAYAGAIFSNHPETMTLSVASIALILMSNVYTSYEPAIRPPRSFYRGRWRLKALGRWSFTLLAPVSWIVGSWRIDFGAILLLHWFFFSNLLANRGFRQITDQRRVDVNNRLWLSRQRKRTTAPPRPPLPRLPDHKGGDMPS